jgi:hypothetical protein
MIQRHKTTATGSSESTKVGTSLWLIRSKFGKKALPREAEWSPNPRES